MDSAAVEEVQLTVFGQQVGGHSLFLKLSDRAVCKPLLSREQFFYESIPQELRNYTPEYYGVSHVTCDPDFVSCSVYFYRHREGPISSCARRIYSICTPKGHTRQSGGRNDGE